MIDNDFLEPFNELTPEQIDSIVVKMDVDSILWQEKNDLYVPPKMRNDLSEPTWKYKMNTFGKLLQEKMN